MATAMDQASSSGVYKASLESHDSAFHKLLGLIPAKFYVPVEASEVESKFQKNKRTKSEKQQEAEERKLKTKAARRAKLDPENVKTVDDLRAERREKDIDVEFDNGEEQKVDEVDEGEDMDMAQDIDADASTDAEGSMDAEAESVPETSKMPPSDAADSAPRPSKRASISELRERLHNKIQMLHNKRQPLSTEAGVPSTKQELLEARRRQRGELRDNRRRERKEARRQAKEGSKSASSEKVPAAASGSSRSAGLLVNDPKTSTQAASTPMDGKLSFSHVSFETRDAPDTARKNKYALPSDPKAALAALEARKRKEEAKIQKQVERGEDATAAREAAQNADRWGKALAASEGVRVRDNVHFLKQTIKRREKSKERSAKSWNERRKAEQEAQAAKQKRRMENLAARRAHKKGGADKTKKGTRAPSKARPGFEGSSRSFTGGQRKTSSGGSSRSSKR